MSKHLKYQNLTKHHNKCLYFILLIFFLSSLPLLLVSQRNIKIKGVKGACSMADNMTPEQTKNKAILEAKKEALLRAGITENISSTYILNISQSSEDFQQIFNSISAIELDGEVKEWELINEKWEVDGSGNPYLEVTINATVIKYKTERDLSFDFKVEGIKEWYYDSTFLEFTFLPYQDGYLRIFLFGDNYDAKFLFPNKYEKNKLFHKGIEVQFPLNVNYRLVAEKKEDADLLVFVYTKQDIPYTKKENIKDILEWIYSIPKDERAIQHFSFVIHH
jgi:hypothetical protein